MSLITLRSGEASAVLDTRGGRVAQLTVRGHDLLVPFTDRWTLSGCYPMVPWAGRLAHGRFRFGDALHDVPVPKPPHALHGVATDVEWDHVDGGVMRVDLGEGWPLGGTAQVTYSLDDAALRCSIAVTAAAHSMPAVVGFHPCFVRAVDGQPDHLDFAPGYMWERGDDYLPTGVQLRPPPAGPWDDCFGDVSVPPAVSWGDVMRVELRSSTSTWVVFDQLDEAICVEPQSAPPNAFNAGGGAVLASGETLELGLDVAWA